MDIGGFDVGLGEIGSAGSFALKLMGNKSPKPVQRVGDFNSGGGIAIGPGHNNVLINGKPALKPYTPFTPHWGCGPQKPQECVGVVAIVGSASSVRANGVPLVLDGATDSCLKHSRMMGSKNVVAK